MNIKDKNLFQYAICIVSVLSYILHFNKSNLERVLHHILALKWNDLVRNKVKNSKASSCILDNEEIRSLRKTKPPPSTKTQKHQVKNNNKNIISNTKA